ncbi:endonuclease/exonuclease/phosphatase family protein [Haliangium ochraceum]|uniref:Endonuclease/exonuclease/phosphatase n=1 Tax=Haliangium ochraceum (strain DSM 14365 / JCM 11303 / SMP-2) TaxID=502025 RepID=D0LW74_HALO1|nr:endonuclease/exonuclease/phosphatase family protein [Haliangium ochraceum]ACY16006.1 Endonuclease/exonuclease/phosphatase [Haliangium ochraceum DSM 14365]
MRVVTLNLWGTTPPLATRLALAAEQLRALAVDVVALQEVRHAGDGRTTAAHLAEALGFQHHYAAAVRWTAEDWPEDVPGAGAGEEGLAILSRHGLAECRALALPEARPTEARILLSAAIDAPAGRCWVHTTHLHYALDDGLARERQVLAIDHALRACAAEEPAAVHILCGDFNAEPDSDEMRFLRGLCTLAGRRSYFQDAFAHRHPGEDGVTWCTERGAARARRSMDRDRRLDYIYVSKRQRDGRGTVREARVVLGGRSGEVAASDHYGVLADVQIAPAPALGQS